MPKITLPRLAVLVLVSWDPDGLVLSLFVSGCTVACHFSSFVELIR